MCGSLSILWHCLSLGLEWKLTFSSPVATAEFSKFAGILSTALSKHHLSGILETLLFGAVLHMLFYYRKFVFSSLEFLLKRHQMHTKLTLKCIPIYSTCQRRQWQPNPVLLPGKSHGQRSLVGCSSWVGKELDTTERLHFHFHFQALEKEMETPSSVLAWRIPGMGSLVGCPLWRHIVLGMIEVT